MKPPSLFCDAWNNLDADTRSAIERSLDAIATRQANENYGHFGCASLSKLEVFAAIGVGSVIKVHFVFDVHDAVVPQSGSIPAFTTPGPAPAR